MCYDELEWSYCAYCPLCVGGFSMDYSAGLSWPLASANGGNSQVIRGQVKKKVRTFILQLSPALLQCDSGFTSLSKDTLLVLPCPCLQHSLGSRTNQQWGLEVLDFPPLLALGFPPSLTLYYLYWIIPSLNSNYPYMCHLLLVKRHPIQLISLLQDKRLYQESTEVQSAQRHNLNINSSMGTLCTMSGNIKWYSCYGK